MGMATEILQIAPLEAGWTLNYVWIENGKSKIDSLPLTGQALVKRYYSGDDSMETEIEYTLFNPCTQATETHKWTIEQINELENGHFVAICKPGESISQDQIAEAVAKIEKKNETVKMPTRHDPGHSDHFPQGR
jgi:hypothetical protein